MRFLRALYADCCASTEEVCMKKGKFDKYIKIRGAAEHNLKNIDVDIPRDKLVVLTG